MTKVNRIQFLLPILSPLIAIASALIVGAILIIFAGANPITAYTALFQESLSTYFGFGNTLTKMTPLLFTSLGVLVALKAGQFNIGGEGQIYLGALGSTLIGLYVQGLPAIIHIPLALLAGFIFGAVWGWIPGYLKAVRGVNEVITTLLLNYIAINLISYLVQNPLKAPTAPSPYSPLIAKSAQLPIILPGSLAHAGIILALITAAILWILLVRSPLGYQITAVGFNPIAARYARMSVERTIMFVMALAGGLAGLAGATEVMGLKYRLFEQISPGYGFDAIAIAFLSRGNIGGVVLTSLFFAALRSGANVMQRSAGVPVTVVYAIQGLTVLFIAISLAVETRRNAKA
ncbi:ABC transporter permease [Nostoc sp. FACHB-152]|uniref:ABC transporter permease n=1 Tax=unclassified Nostoc TaxID=2593658 RepID=UPI001682BE86|nr:MULTISPECIES: ABC transporter permease [unclassified Nostoc]MBD2447374.1 ABC transporter permease [Nostoc sp. FACHB-152]MBD2468024.1 ABC transporter permease [Nostoc sp. FACHB-145]